MVLVDRSSSMWDSYFWDPLRDAMLEVIEVYQDDIRFGLATFTGETAVTCPVDFESVGTIGTGQYTNIHDFWVAIEPPEVPTETPTAAAVQAVMNLLLSDGANGPKAILLLTDGNPDYCDNGAVECRADTTVRAIQDAYDAGITTLVAGLPDSTIDVNWFAAYANAGAGEGATSPYDYLYTCPPPPGETAALFPYTFPMGEYLGGGSAEATFLDPGDHSGTVTALSGLLDGLAPCD
jgi:hypothetical protein